MCQYLGAALALMSTTFLYSLEPKHWAVLVPSVKSGS